MLKHILTIIWNQRKSNAWLIIELFIISVSFWFIIDYTGLLLYMEKTPTGFDISHTYRVFVRERTPESDSYISTEDKKTSLGEDLLSLVERIRQHPSIDATSVSVNSQPYGNAISQIYRELIYDDTLHIIAQQYWVSPSFFDVFHIHSTHNDMATFKEALTSSGIIATPQLEKELSSGESILGKSITISDEGVNKRIEAISAPIRTTEYRLENIAYFTLLSEQQIITQTTSNNVKGLEICIRVKPETDKDFINTFIEEMGSQLIVGNLFLVDVRSSYVTRQRVVQGQISQKFTNTILLIFLSLNIFLGIFGTFTFRTQQRKGEMGLRMAIGSKRKSLMVLIAVEGLILLGLATLPAILIDLNIGMVELLNVYWMKFTPLRFFSGVLFTFLTLGLMIVIGIWIPAWRTSKIHPAEALHYE